MQSLQFETEGEGEGGGYGNGTEGGQEPRASGVVFVDEPTGRVHVVKARKEVIVSMGAFHSPQLMMVSVSFPPSSFLFLLTGTDSEQGIGPAATLEKFGITPVLVNENVGQGYVISKLLQSCHLHSEEQISANSKLE